MAQLKLNCNLAISDGYSFDRITKHPAWDGKHSPSVGEDGTFEIPCILDFHTQSDYSEDFSVRLDAIRNGAGTLSIVGPTNDVYGDLHVGDISCSSINVVSIGAGTTWDNHAPVVGSDGVMEIGKVLDFHVTKGSTIDYDARIIVENPGSGAWMEISTPLYAKGFYVSSSREVKTNIKPSDKDALDIVKNTEVVDFNYKDDLTRQKVGFISEDTDSILCDPDHKSIDTVNCIGILMKAVQQLDQKLTSLEASIYGRSQHDF